MIAIKVMRQENKYILKMVDRLYEAAKEAHYTKQLSIEKVESCLDFFEEYVVNYQQVKQEETLFKGVTQYADQEVEPVVESMIILHGQAKKYLEEMNRACNLYRQGRYLAIYPFINSAMSYQAVAKQCIKEEENFYSYTERVLPDRYKALIDTQIANFHRQIEKQNYINLPKQA